MKKTLSALLLILSTAPTCYANPYVDFSEKGLKKGVKHKTVEGTISADNCQHKAEQNRRFSCNLTGTGLSESEIYQLQETYEAGEKGHYNRNPSQGWIAQQPHYGIRHYPFERRLTDHHRM